MCQVPEVENTEHVLRAIFEPSFLEDDGSLSPSAFYMQVLSRGKKENYISVFRKEYGEKLGIPFPTLKPRVHGDTLCGYAELLTKDVRDISIGAIQVDIKEFPTKSNPAHAVIYIVINHDEQNADDFSEVPLSSQLLFVLKQLTNKSIFNRLA